MNNEEVCVYIVRNNTDIENAWEHFGNGQFICDGRFVGERPYLVVIDEQLGKKPKHDQVPFVTYVQNEVAAVRFAQNMNSCTLLSIPRSAKGLQGILQQFSMPYSYA